MINWSPNAVKNLLRSANEAIINEETTKRTNLSWKEFSDIIAYEWLEMFVEKGITKEVLNELNKRISWIEYRRALVFSESGEPSWREVAINNSLNHPDLKTTYIVSHLLAQGEFKNLRRCKLKDCGKFFVGPPNRTWCSKGCGSLFRIRKKRKKDKN